MTQYRFLGEEIASFTKSSHFPKAMTLRAILCSSCTIHTFFFHLGPNLWEKSTYIYNFIFKKKFVLQKKVRSTKNVHVFWQPWHTINFKRELTDQTVTTSFIFVALEVRKVTIVASKASWTFVVVQTALKLYVSFTPNIPHDMKGNLLKTINT